MNFPKILIKRKGYTDKNKTFYTKIHSQNTNRTT